jgi:holo-[acyl-carrier protein] synthase
MDVSHGLNAPMDAPRLAIGVDLELVPRIAAILERHPERFLERHFTAREQADCAGAANRLAARWAAKEAVSKALGSGIGQMEWHEVEIVCDETGAPHLHLHGEALRVAQELGLSAWSISLSHVGEQALAVAAAVGAPIRSETVS